MCILKWLLEHTATSLSNLSDKNSIDLLALFLFSFIFSYKQSSLFLSTKNRKYMTPTLLLFGLIGSL